MTEQVAKQEELVAKATARLDYLREHLPAYEDSANRDSAGRDWYMTDEAYRQASAIVANMLRYIGNNGPKHLVGERAHLFPYNGGVLIEWGGARGLASIEIDKHGIVVDASSSEDIEPLVGNDTLIISTKELVDFVAKSVAP